MPGEIMATACAPTVKTMCVVKVVGDGNCLFHALALHEGGSGEELKAEILDHMEILADEDEGMRQAWWYTCPMSP